MLFTVFHAFLASTVLPIGGTLEGPQVVTVEEFAVDLPLPAGWKAVRASETLIILGKGANEGAVFLMFSQGEEADLVAALSKETNIQKIKLLPADPAPKRIGGALTIRYEPPAPGTAAFGVGRVNHEEPAPNEKRAFIAMGVVKDALKRAFAAEAANIALAAVFKPTAPSPHLPFLSGRSLTHRSSSESSGGLSDNTDFFRETYSLCRDGRFQEVSSSQSHSPANRALGVELNTQSRDVQKGRWSLHKDTLILRHDDGKVRRMGITRASERGVKFGKSLFYKSSPAGC